jgi:hypothetical protein
MPALLFPDRLFRICIRFRLGLAIPELSTDKLCHCGYPVRDDPYGHHLFSCACGERIYLHNLGIHAWQKIFDDVRRLSFRTEVPLLRELGMSVPSIDANQRMDFIVRLLQAVTIPSRAQEECDHLFCDFTLVDPCCDSYCKKASKSIGVTALDAEQRKVTKYAKVVDCVSEGRLFVPIGMECFGCLGRCALELLHALAHDMPIDDERDRSIACGRLVERWMSLIGSIVQKGVARYLLNRMASINGRSMSYRSSIHELLHRGRKVPWS